MENIIEKTRELAKLIQADPAYKNLVEAREKNDNDAELQDLIGKFKLKRIPACIAVLVISIILGLVSTLGYGIWAEVKVIGMQFLDFFDFISNSVIMPIVALITCIFVGYIIKPKSIIEEVEYGNIKFKAKKLFVVVIKYIAPVCILIILASSVLGAFGIISI